MSIKKYLKIWKILSFLAASSYLSNRIDSISYFIGKIVRFIFFLVLIFSIFNFTDTMAGYSEGEVIMFFLIFNLMDVLAQAFFRGVYLLRNDVRLGNFDFFLVRPVNPLFYSLTKLTDILDIIFLAPIIALIIYFAVKIKIALAIGNLLPFFLLFAAGLIILVAIHIISAAIIVWTVESENFIWLYRETMTIGRFPPEIFPALLQFIFTFLMPIMIIVAFPVKAFLNALAWPWIIFALGYTLFFLYLALLLWKKSLKNYSSASS